MSNIVQQSSKENIAYSTSDILVWHALCILIVLCLDICYLYTKLSPHNSSKACFQVAEVSNRICGDRDNRKYVTAKYCGLVTLGLLRSNCVKDISI